MKEKSLVYLIDGSATGSLGIIVSRDDMKADVKCLAPPWRRGHTMTIDLGYIWSVAPESNFEEIPAGSAMIILDLARTIHKYEQSFAALKTSLEKIRC